MQSPDPGTDLQAGWALADHASGEAPEFEDPAVAWGHAQDSLQLAGLNFKGVFGKQSGRSTGSILRQAETPRPLQVDRAKLKGIMDLIPDSLDAQPLDQKFIDSGTLNLERSHIGAAPLDKLREATGNNPSLMLDAAENAQDLGKVFNIIGTEMNLTDAPRTFSMIKDRSKEQMLKDLAPVLDGRQLGLTSDRQLYALSSLQAAVGDEMIAAARVIKAGKGTDETRIAYQQSVETVIALEAMLVGNTREVARALSARRIYANSLAFGDLSALTRAFSQGGMTPEAINQSAEVLLTKLLKEGKTAAIHGAAIRATPLEAAVEFWKSNVLSAPGTHVLNMGSNAAVFAYEKIFVDPTAAAISAARRSLKLGVDEGAHFSEFLPSLHGAFIGTRDGLRSAIEIILNPTSQGEFGAGSKVDAGGSAAADVGGRLTAAAGLGERPGQLAGAAATFPLRLMKAEDEAFKATAYRSMLAQLQMRAAVDLKLEGPALASYLDDAIDHPSYDMHKEAIQFADRVTFQQRGGGGLIALTSSHVATYLEALPIFKFVAPFVRTTSNLMDYAVDNSPLAFTAFDARAGTPMAERLKFFDDIRSGGARSDYAMARFVLGSAVTALAYTLYQNGTITGPGPDNQGQLEVLKRLGYQPNALVIGNKTYAFDRLDPLASVIEMTTGAFDKARFAKREEDATMHIMDAIMSFSNHMMNSTFMESLQRFVQVFFGGDQAGPAVAKFIGATVSGFIPYEAALAAVGRAREEAVHVPSYPHTLGIGGKDTLKDLGDIIAQTGATKLPWNRDELRPRRYWDGSLVIPETYQLSRLIAPIKVTEIKKDKASSELAKNGIGAKEPQPEVSIKGVSFNLLDFDLGRGLVYDAYIKDVGEMRKQAVESVVDSGPYESAGAGVSGERALLLERALSQGHTKGEHKFFLETLPAMVDAKKVDLNPLARALGTDVSEVITAMKKGEVVSSKAARFEARGAPGKTEVKLPQFTFD